MNMFSKNKELTGYTSIDRPQDKGYNFFARHPFIPDMNVYNAIKLLNIFYMKNNAVECLDLVASYDQLFKDSVTISLALKELGVKKGEIVAASMPNFYQALAVFLACNRIGVMSTFLNSGSAQEEQNEYLNLFETPILINYDIDDELNKSIKDNTKVRHIITLDKDKINSLDLNGNYRITSKENSIDFNSLGSIAEFKKPGLELHGGKTNALVLFTSGTTGKPKSVVITNENVLAAGIYQKYSGRSTSFKGDKTLVCVPFSYPYGLVTSAIMTLLLRKTAILAPFLTKDNISCYLNKNPNIIFGSPALLELIMKNIPEDQDLSSIYTYISGGDFLSPAANKRGVEFFRKHNANDIRIGNGSGNAETVSSGTNPVGNEIRPETAGKLLVGTDAIVVNSETMEELPYGVEGMLCVAGKHVFKGYYEDEELTNEVIFMRDGKRFFKTGTRGFIDEDGYFTIKGRESRFYILSTLNKVYCDHVQNIISYFDCIDDCAVVKVPDNDMLYVNKVYVVLKEGFQPSNEIIEHIRELCNHPVITKGGENQQLKWYEIPTYIEFVDVLPRKEGTEKIDYMLLEKDAEEKEGNNIRLQKEDIKKKIKCKSN